MKRVTEIVCHRTRKFELKTISRIIWLSHLINRLWYELGNIEVEQYTGIRIDPSNGFV
jgi:hypothetical protein